LKALVGYDSVSGNTEIIAKILKTKGIKAILSNEDFIIIGQEGPLKEGELERAVARAKGLTDNRKQSGWARIDASRQ